MTIYIHGFGSSGQGGKAIQLREYFKSINEPFIAPSLSYVPELAVATLEELIDSYEKEKVTLIGSSLGGYYTIYLAEKYGVKAVLINPAIESSKTLKRAVDLKGVAKNYYDGSSFSWNASHLEMLKGYAVSEVKCGEYLLLLQKGDDILDYKEAVAKIPNAMMVIEEGGTHPFEGVERHFEKIRTFFALNGTMVNRHLGKLGTDGFSLVLFGTKVSDSKEFCKMVNQESITKAWFFASKVHKEQLYPGDKLPYLTHLGNVMMEVMSVQHSIENAELAIVCAILHDTIEDTMVSYSELEKEFGEAVAKGVMALSKDETLSTKSEQMLDSLERIVQEPKAVWVVKMADRVANLGKPPHYWKASKVKAYQDEARLILEKLGLANRLMAERLAEKIEQYKKYIGT